MSEDKSSYPVAVRLEGIKPGEEKPSVALYLMGLDGRVERKIALAKDDRLSVPHGLTKRAHVVAVGPDVENPQGLSVESVMQFRSEELRAWQETKVINVPRSVWLGWVQFFVRLSGKVERCLPILRNQVAYSLEV